MTGGRQGARTRGEGASAGTTPRDLALVTCSMPADLELFALLARSVDECVAPGISHRVVVPGRALPTFRRFATPRREIIAQEDVLPMRLAAMPGWLRHLSVLSGGLRRPIYLDARLRVLRGWLLQQIIKIEMARHAAEAAVMHVDSDTFFVRPLAAGDAFDDGRPRFFRVEGRTGNPEHRPWIGAAERLLGIEVPADWRAHYVENCIVWSPEVVRAMVARIEAVRGIPYHRAMAAEASFSEYYLYGIFVDLLASAGSVAPMASSFCNSHWSPASEGGFDREAHLARLDPGQCAIAVQSTHPLSAAERREIYGAVRDAGAAGREERQRTDAVPDGRT